MPLKKIPFCLIFILNLILIVYQTYPHKIFNQYFNYATVNWILITTIYFLLQYSSPNTVFITFISGFFIDIVNQEYLGLYTFLFFILYLMIAWIKQYLSLLKLPIFMLLVFFLSLIFNSIKLIFILLIFDFYEFVYYLKDKFFIEIIINTLASIFVYGIGLLFFKENHKTTAIDNSKKS